MDGFDLGSAAALAKALGGKPEGGGCYRASCPSCGRGNLQIRDGHTRLLEQLGPASDMMRPTKHDRSVFLAEELDAASKFSAVVAKRAPGSV
jgi:hypothetical protein